jgi:YaiO family outer membrane protein
MPLIVQAQLPATFSDARTLAYAGNNESALRILDSLYSQQPQNNDWNLFRARVLSWDKQFEKAIGIAKPIAQSDKREPQAFEIWSTSSLWNGDVYQALTAADAGLKEYPEEESLMPCLARALAASKRYEESLSICDSVLRKREKARDIRLIQLNTFLAIDSLDTLVRLCDSLITAEPGHLDWQVMRSRADTRRGLFDEALDKLNRVIQKDASRLDAHLFYCQNCLFDGGVDSARVTADSALRRWPDDPSLLLCLAKSYLYKNVLDTADSLAGRVIQIDSNDYDAHKVWYNIKLARGENDTILINSEKWKGVNPDDEELPRLRALAQLGKKRYNTAREELAPDDDRTDSLEVLSKLVYLDAYYFQRRYTPAIELSERYLTQHPSHPQLMLARANLLHSVYAKKEALALVDSVLKVDSTDKNAIALRLDLLENVYLNELGGFLSYDYYDNGLDPRSAATFEYLRRIRRHVIVARLTVADRFDDQGIQFEIDGYPVLTDWLYLYLNAGLSNNYLFPQYRGLVEPFLRLPAGFEVSLGVRWMSYPTDLVTIYTGSMSYSPGNFLFMFRPYFSIKDSGLFNSYSLIGRYTFTNRYHYAEIFGGYGASPDNSYLDPIFTQAVESRSYNIGATYSFPLRKNLYGKAWFIYDHYMPQQFADFTIYSFNLGCWWKF